MKLFIIFLSTCFCALNKRSAGSGREDWALNFVNRVRARAGVGRVEYNVKLVNASMYYARQLRTYCERTGVQYLPHTDPFTGQDPGRRLKAFSYNWSTYGENIAIGQSAVDQVMYQWYYSTGHYRNMVNPAVTQTGWAKSGNKACAAWSQEFAAPLDMNEPNYYLA